MCKKKFVAFLAAGIFLFNSVTFAQNEEDFPEVDKPFSQSTEPKNNSLDEENFPPVDEPFAKDHSSTINHTEERDKEKISEQPTETPPAVVA